MQAADQQGGDRLVQRVLGARPVERGDRLRAAAQPQQALRPALQGPHALPVQAGGEDAPQLRLRQVGQRGGPAPQPQGLAQQRDRGGVPLRPGVPVRAGELGGAGGEPLEAQRVDQVGRSVQPVARRPGLQGERGAREQLAQGRDVPLERGPGLGGGRVAPEQFEQPGHRDDPPQFERQQRQHTRPLGPAGRHRATVGGRQLDRSQQSNEHGSPQVDAGWRSVPSRFGRQSATCGCPFSEPTDRSFVRFSDRLWRARTRPPRPSATRPGTWWPGVQAAVGPRSLT